MKKPEIIPCYGTSNLSRRHGKIEYIVIHYTAGVTDKPGTALANAQYYGGGMKGASADFFVDKETIIQYNEDIKNAYSWAVGGNRYIGTKGGKLYGVCTNRNSVSIEMCSYNTSGKVANANDKTWRICKEVYQKTVELTRWLMEELDVDADHVIRHYDVTGKLCPGVIGWNEASGDTSHWARFQKDIRFPESEETEMPKIYHYVAEMPEWAREAATKAINAGIIKMDNTGAVNVYEQNLQPLVWLDRLGLLENY